MDRDRPGQHPPVKTESAAAMHPLCDLEKIYNLLYNNNLYTLGSRSLLPKLWGFCYSG